MNKLTKIAWVPANNSELWSKGVKAIGGRITHKNLSETQADSVVCQLNRETRDSLGQYIVVREHWGRNA